MRPMLLVSLLTVPLAIPAAAVASLPATGATASPSLYKSSTGVTPARVIHTARIPIPNSVTINELPSDAKVVLQLQVDRNGDAHGIRVLSSADPFLDLPVMEAVSEFRFRPAMLDHEAVPVKMRLTVKIKDPM